MQLARLQQQTRLVLGNVRPFLRDENGNFYNSQQCLEGTNWRRSNGWGTANGWMATKGGRASELALREGGKRADSGVVKWRLRANSNPMNLVLIKGDFVPPFRLYQ